MRLEGDWREAIMPSPVLLQMLRDEKGRFAVLEGLCRCLQKCFRNLIFSNAGAGLAMQAFF